MNIHIEEPQSTRATKILATIGLAAILVALLFFAIQSVQFIFPENASSPAAVIESRNESIERDEDIPAPMSPSKPDEEKEAPPVVPVISTPQSPVVATQPVVAPYVDLRIRVQSIGFMSGNTFFTSSIIDSNIRGGIQFEVQNIGNTPSRNWSVRTNLPNGETYTLNNQAGLTPNEISIVTVAFDPRDRDGTYSFNATLSSSGESTTSNNYVNGSMTFVD